MSALCIIFHKWSRWSLGFSDNGIIQTRYCRRCRLTDVQALEIRESGRRPLVPPQPATEPPAKPCR